MERNARGSALLAALLVIGVLAFVTVATLTIAAISKEQSAKDTRTLSQASCVEAARQYIVGRLRVFGLDPTTITLDQAISVESGTRKMRTGHVNGPVVTSIQALPATSVSGGGGGVRDLTNIIGNGVGLGGKGYRVVVACTDPLAGDMELEFAFKYGL